MRSRPQEPPKLLSQALAVACVKHVYGFLYFLFQIKDMVTMMGSLQKEVREEEVKVAKTLCTLNSSMVQ